MWLLASVVALLLAAGVGLALILVAVRYLAPKRDATPVDAFGDPLPVQAAPRAPAKEPAKEPVAAPVPAPAPVAAPEAVAAPVPEPVAVVEPAPAPPSVTAPRVSELGPTPTLIAAPPEPVVTAPDPVVAPEPVVTAPEPVVTPEPAAPAEPAPVTFEPLEKLRVADLGVIMRVHATHLGGQDLLAFTTEGFAARDRKELVVYAPRSVCPEADVVRALKRFAGVALVLLERPEPARLGELLKLPGEIGPLQLGGFLVVEPNEPAAVPVGDHVVLIGLNRRHLATDEAALRAMLVAQHGGVPFVTAPEPVAG